MLISKIIIKIPTLITANISQILIHYSSLHIFGILYAFKRFRKSLFLILLGGFIMSYIYTCNSCTKQYTVYAEGDYICDCGNMFHYPSIAPILKYNFSTPQPQFDDSATQSVQISKKFHAKKYKSRSFANQRECPLAKTSLICAILSVIFFGILALPALIMGVFARMLIADKKYNYSGDGVAISAILLSVVSFAAWGSWFISLL